eukprot:NODE_8257_length_1510_cov_4.857556.p1 GENE.NODE_8257_length_1510_cov_4.857556~~NODE_8257_length_1510_cov_4.857556.p1  ORF type:complete len:486 (+),score=108.96 NODE_8257_length_1510_cov_4.857556:2-1459(+)
MPTACHTPTTGTSRAAAAAAAVPATLGFNDGGGAAPAINHHSLGVAVAAAAAAAATAAAALAAGTAGTTAGAAPAQQQVQHLQRCRARSEDALSQPEPPWKVQRRCDVGPGDEQTAGVATGCGRGPGWPTGIGHGAGLPPQQLPPPLLQPAAMPSVPFMGASQIHALNSYNHWYDVNCGAGSVSQGARGNAYDLLLAAAGVANGGSAVDASAQYGAQAVASVGLTGSGGSWNAATQGVGNTLPGYFDATTVSNAYPAQAPAMMQNATVANADGGFVSPGGGSVQWLGGGATGSGASTRVVGAASAAAAGLGFPSPWHACGALNANMQGWLQPDAGQSAAGIAAEAAAAVAVRAQAFGQGGDGSAAGVSYNVAAAQGWGQGGGAAAAPEFAGASCGAPLFGASCAAPPQGFGSFGQCGAIAADWQQSGAGGGSMVNGCGQPHGYLWSLPQGFATGTAGGAWPPCVPQPLGGGGMLASPAMPAANVS